MTLSVRAILAGNSGFFIISTDGLMISYDAA